MSLITKANARQAAGIKGVILGPSGIGKTTLLETLPPEETLFIDLEAGGLSVKDWPGDSIDVFKRAAELGAPAWEFMRALASWIGGPNAAVPKGEPYSAEFYEAIKGAFGDPAQLDKYKTFFVDSITVAIRSCMAWCRTQPRAFSQKKVDARTGKPAQDMLGAYGLLKEEGVAWLTQLQHVTNKNVWLVGILDRHKDDFGRMEWVPQIEGSGVALALPGIVDQVISMVEVAAEDNTKFRAFVCQTLNQWGYPAKDRSGQLDMLEKPHLGELMAKIAAAKPRAALAYGMPGSPAATGTGAHTPASAEPVDPNKPPF